MSRVSALLEYASTSLTPDRVDRARGVVKGVKVIGRTSKNTHRREGVEGTEYDPEGLRRAVPLYEGAEVYAGHPDPDEVYAGKRKPRDPEKKVGKLVNVRATAEGLFADLVLDTTKPLARSVMEAASDPLRHDLWSLSHNADATDIVRRGKTLYVPGIAKVHSVDIVGRGGSNKSLFESLEPTMTTTLRALLEGASLDKRLPPERRKKFLAILEDDLPGMDAEMPLPAEDTPADPDAALRDGFKQAINACLDGDDDVAAMVKKIKDLLKAREQALGAINGEAPKGDKAAPEADEEPKKKDDGYDEEDTVKESREQKAAGVPLMEADEARELCELAGLRPETTKALLEGLTQMPRKAAVGLIKHAKGFAAPVAVAKARGPVSSPPRPLLEQKDVPEDRKAWLKRLRPAREILDAETN